MSPHYDRDGSGRRVGSGLVAIGEEGRWWKGFDDVVLWALTFKGGR